MRGMRAPVLPFPTLLLLAFSPPTARACDLCNAPPKPAFEDLSEHLFELTADSIETVVASHELLVLVLYDDATASHARLRNFATAASTLKGMEPTRILLATIDVGAYAEVAHRLEVPQSTLPAVRLLRGDASFGSEYHGGHSSPDEVVGALLEELQLGGESVVTRLRPEDEAEWRAANDTRVVARLRRPESLRAYMQVASAFRRAIRFGLLLPAPPSAAAAPPLAPPSTPPDGSSPPPRSPPPLAPAPPPPPPPPLRGAGEAGEEEDEDEDEDGEEVELLRERTVLMQGEPELLRMPRPAAARARGARRAAPRPRAAPLPPAPRRAAGAIRDRGARVRVPQACRRARCSTGCAGPRCPPFSS